MISTSQESHDKLSPDQVWQAALGELQLQMTGATFNTWLGRTGLVGYKDGLFTVGVHNQLAKNWLEKRLDAMIKRSLRSVCGRDVEIQFVVWHQDGAERAPVPALEAVAIEEPRIEAAEGDPRIALTFDPSDIGFFPVDVYAGSFWRPYLTRRSRYAWAIWEIVRAEDKRTKADKASTPWTPPATWSAPELAELVGCGIQAITGVSRSGEERRAGALECLSLADVGRYSRQGKFPRMDYEVSVRVILPVLRPEQARDLAVRLCTRHDRFLREHGVDPSEWIEARRELGDSSPRIAPTVSVMDIIRNET